MKARFMDACDKKIEELNCYALRFFEDEMDLEAECCSEDIRTIERVREYAENWHWRNAFEINAELEEVEEEAAELKRICNYLWEEEVVDDEAWVRYWRASDEILCLSIIAEWYASGEIEC